MRTLLPSVYSRISRMAAGQCPDHVLRRHAVGRQLAAAARSPARPWSHTPTAAARTRVGPLGQQGGNDRRSARRRCRPWPGRSCRWCSPARSPSGDGGDGPVALQHQNAAVGRGEGPGRPSAGPRRLRSPPIRANSTVVGRQHRGPAPAGIQYIYMPGQGVYAVGVQHQRLLRFSAASQHQVRDSLPAAAQPRPQRQRIAAVQPAPGFPGRAPSARAYRVSPAEERALRRRTWPPPPARWSSAPPATPARTRSAPPPTAVR